MPPLPVPGIQIQLIFDKMDVEANFIIRLHGTGPFFVTNREIRAAIEKNPSLDGATMGYTRTWFDSTTKIITMNNFYPFSSLPENTKSSFMKKGIAQLLEYIVLRHTLHRFPRAKFIRHGEVVLDAREMHVSKRETRGVVPVEEWMRTLSRKIGIDTLAARRGISRDDARQRIEKYRNPRSVRKKRSVSVR